MRWPLIPRAPCDETRGTKVFAFLASFKCVNLIDVQCKNGAVVSMWFRVPYGCINCTHGDVNNDPLPYITSPSLLGDKRELEGLREKPWMCQSTQFNTLDVYHQSTILTTDVASSYRLYVITNKTYCWQKIEISNLIAYHVLRSWPPLNRYPRVCFRPKSLSLSLRGQKRTTNWRNEKTLESNHVYDLNLHTSHANSFLIKYGKKTFHQHRNSLSHHYRLGLEGASPYIFLLIFVLIPEYILPPITNLYDPSEPSTKFSNPDLVRND